MSEPDSKLRIAVLHPSYAESNAPFAKMDPTCSPARYLPEAVCTDFFIHKRTAVKQVVEAAQQGFDVFFNLCDGAWAEDRPGIEVVQALERLNVPFTGAGSLFYEPSREAMKMACESVGVKFPAYVMARCPSDVERAAATLRYPMIVKHPNSYGSVGLTRESRVTNAAALRQEFARTCADYGAALIEEFIEGREFDVLMSEPREGEDAPLVLPPIEFLFPPGETFKTFDVKWVNWRQMESVLVKEEPLASRLREIGGLVFWAMNGSGLGRCDLRMDAAGEIYLLEINPNCETFCPDGEFGSSDFVLTNIEQGHTMFARHLIMCALRRQKRSERVWEIRYDRATGFGLYAARAIPTGAVVEPYEERPCTLVSTSHVERNWRGLKRQWFDKYAWPVGEGVHAIWSADSAEWRPLNHSCDPNVWLSGLDLVARRDILMDEPLTADYATFCGPAMKEFECSCDSPLCRRTIRGGDHLLPELRDRYGCHTSAYVRAASKDVI